MNPEYKHQNQENGHGHAHHWWHMLMCLAMVGAFFFLGFRNKDTVIAPPPYTNWIETESGFEEQRAEADGVTVIAHPRRIEEGLVFDLTFDTHSGELDFDAARAIALIDASGIEVAPRELSGDSSGGHHRKIIVSFDTVSDAPFTLVIRNVGGVTERVFRWSMK